jgi:hypothetical protein
MFNGHDGRGYFPRSAFSILSGGFNDSVFYR